MPDAARSRHGRARPRDEGDGLTADERDLIDTLFDRYVEQLIVHSVRLTAEDLCGEAHVQACPELRKRIVAYEELEGALSELRGLSAGSRLGPYDIVQELGRGGMGMVYAAVDRRDGERLALKVLPERWAQDSHRRRRFEREATLLERLAHPNIVRFRSFEVIEPFIVLAMERVEGRDLAARIADGGLPSEALVHIACSVLEALDCAHANGVLHRDLKPGNVMWDGAESVKVLDFGLGVLLGDSRVTTLTNTGDVVGTLLYLAPEALLGRPTDQRADLFSFGATMYECATGTRAFTGTTASTIMQSIFDDEPAPLDGRRPDLPPKFCAAISACLTKALSMRPASARVVRDMIGSPP